MEAKIDNTITESEGITIVDYLRAIWKRRWLVLLIFLIVFFSTVVFTIRQPKIYESVATIEIGLQADNVLSNVSEVYELGDISYWDSKAYYETQYKVIQSRLVAEAVVERLHLDRDLAFLGLDKIEDKKKLTEALNASDPARILLASLKVDPIENSRLVLIRYKSTDSKKATTIVNAIAEAYIEQNLNRKLVSTRHALNWLTEQMHDLKSDLEKSELALYDFKKENDILSTNMDERVNFTGTRLAELNRQLSISESEYLRAKQHFESMKKANEVDDWKSVASLSIMNDSLIKDLKIRHADLENEHAELLLKYREKHPEVLLVKSQLERTRDNLNREIKGIVDGAQAEYLAAKKTFDILATEVEDLKNQARSMTLKEVEYNRLVREVDSNRIVFEQVLKRLKEIDLSGMLKVNNIRMLDLGKEPDFPIRPRVKVNLIIGVMLGLFLSFGAAILLDVMDKTLKSGDDIQKYLGLPLLGIIPEVKIDPDSEEGKIPNAAEIFARLKPNSSLAECCRTVRTNISFMMPGKTIRRILITSASPKEGKTTIVSNFGITLASSGKRTLIVDTDMRRPRIHKAFKVHNEYGVSNVVAGTMTPEEAIRNTGIENLDIMTCGPIPPNPSEMVGSDKFREVMEGLFEQYDRIIFDSPPVIAVTDAAILSNLVDGVILVVKCGKTLRDEAIHSRKLLIDVKANVLGVVINHLDMDNREYGNYYYYYYRRYGYYYGEKENDPKKNGA